MTRYRNALLFLLLAAIWGTAFVATKAGLRDLPPVTFAALRFDVAAAIMFAYAAARGADLRPAARGDVTYVVLGGVLCIGLHHALLFAGQQYVTPAVAAVLLGLIPIVTPVLTRLTESDEPLALPGVLGVLVGFGGVAVIANPDPARLVADATGTLLVFGSALAFAAGAVFTHGESPSLDVLALQPWMMAVGALSLHLAALALPGEGLAYVTVTATSVTALAYLAVVSGALGFTLYFVLLDRLGPTEMSFVEYVIPVFAALGGWLVLGDAVTPLTVAGFLLILAGFVLVKRRAIRAELRARVD